MFMFSGFSLELTSCNKDSSSSHNLWSKCSFGM